MDPIDLGDLFVESTAEGRLLRLTITTQQPTTTLSVEGARELCAYLADWLVTHAEVPPGDEPATREEIAAFLREAGYDPALVETSMQQVADTIIAHERQKRLDAWLDSLQDAPLTPAEIEAIVAEIKQRRTP